MIFILELLLSFLLLLQEESNKHFNSIKIICEQLSLMTQNKLHYSKEMIFSLLLYNCTLNSTDSKETPSQKTHVNTHWRKTFSLGNLRS